MKLKYIPGAVVEGIQNIIEYAPVIWKDRDWDHHFLLVLLEFKLSRMQKRFEDCTRIEDAPKIARQLEMCVNAIRRIKADDYRSSELAALDEKWGDLVCPVCGDFICYCFPDKKGRGYHWIALRENVRSKGDDERCDEEYRALYKQQEEDVEKDLDLLFDTIRNNIRCWWD